MDDRSELESVHSASVYSFVRSSLHSSDEEDETVGLQNGDVVAFAENGVPYAVFNPEASGEWGSPSSADVFDFAPTHLEEGVSIADPTTHLVVIKQGRWLGFRSTISGGKLLQARKRGSSKLCFFNFNFGIFEQWETDDQPGGSGWSTTLMRLRNRRLPNFVLTVEVMKIPLSLQYNPGPGMDPHLSSQRSITGPLPSASSPSVAARVQQFGGDAARLPRPSPSNAGGANSGSVAPVASMLQQNMSTPLQRISHGSSYMQTQIDEAASGQDHVMRKMTGVLIKEWSQFVLKEVKARKEVEKEMALLVSEMEYLRTQTSTEVRGLCEEWRRELEQLLLELNRYRHNERMLKYTTIIKLITNRRTNVTQRATFSNWTHLAQKHKENLLKSDRFCKRRRQGFLQAWHQVAGSSRCVRHAESVVQRKCARVAARHVFDGWLGVMVRKRKHRKMLATALTRISHEIQLSAFLAWRKSARTAHEQEAELGNLENDRRLQLINQVFLAWVVLWEQTCFYISSIQRMQARISARRVRVAVHEWAEGVLARQSTRRRLAAHMLERARKWMHASLVEWQTVMFAQRRNAGIVQRFADRANYVLLSLAFMGWDELREETVELNMAVMRVTEKHKVLMQRRAVEEWAECVRVLKARMAQFSRFLQSKHQATRARVVLEWCHLTGMSRHKSLRLNQFQRRHAHRLRGQAWRAWREAVAQAHVAAREGDEYALDRDAQLLHTVLSAWVVYWEELDERARLINKGLMRRIHFLSKCTFRAWTGRVEYCARVRYAVLRILRRHRMRVQSACLRAWTHDVDQSKMQRTMLARAEVRRRRWVCGISLVHWWEATQLSVTQRASMAGLLARLSSMRAAHCFDQWHETATRAKRQRLLLVKVVHRWKWQSAKTMFTHWRDYTQHLLQSVSLMYLDSSGRLLTSMQQLLRDIVQIWRRVARCNRTTAASVSALSARRGSRLLARAWAAWDCRCGLALRWRSAQNALARRLRLAQLRRTARSWLSEARAMRRGREIAQRREAHRKAKLISEVLHEWSEEAAWQRSDRAQLSEHESTQRQQLLQRVLAQWRGEAQQLAYARKQIHRTIVRMKFLREVQVLHRWHQHARRRTQLSAIQAKLAAKRLRVLLANMLAFWASYASHQRHIMQSASRGIERKIFDLLYAVLVGWMEYTDRNREQKQKQDLAKQKYNKNHLTQYWFAWRNSMFVSNALVRLAVRVTSRAARELSRQSMAAWREVWECAAHKRVLVSMFWGRCARKTAYRSFATWLEAADRAIAGRSQAQVLESKSTRSLLLSIFQGWAWMVDHAKSLADMISRLARRICQRTVAEYFYAIRSHLQMQKRVRKMSQKMVAGLRRALLGTFEDAFLAWAEFAAAQSSIRGLWRKSSALYKHRLLRKAVGGWTHAAAQALHRKRTALKLVRKMERIAKRSAIMDWYQLTQHQHQGRVQMERALARLHLRNMHAAFNTWVDMTSIRRKQRAVVAKCIVRMLHFTLKRAMCAWADRVDETRLTQMTLLRFWRASDARRARRALCGWADCTTADFVAAQTLLHVTAAIHRKSLLRQLFYNWESNARQLRQKHLIKLRMVGQQQAGAVARCLEWWFGWTAHSHWRARTSRAVLRRCNLTCQRWAFRVYFTNMYENKLERHQLSLASTFWKKHSMANYAFVPWLMLHRRRSYLKKLVVVNARRHKRSLLASTYSTWKTAKAARIMDNRLIWAVRRMIQRRLSNLLRIWCNLAHDAAHRRRVCERIVERRVAQLQLRCVASALSSWRRVSAEHKTHRCIQSRIILLRARLLLASTLGAWWSNAKELTQERTMYVKARKFFEQYRQSMCAAAWLKYVAKAKLAKRLALKASKWATAYRLRRGLDAFCSAHLQGKIKTEKAMAHRRILVVRQDQIRKQTAVATWAEHIFQTRIRNQALAKLASGRTRKVTTSSFAWWKHQVSELNRRRRVIKDCITTKRVTMHWFLNWYWMAYEEEIRGSLNLLMGTCDDAMTDLYSAYLPGTHQRVLTHSSGVFERWSEIGSSLQQLSQTTMPSVTHIPMLHGVTDEVRQSNTPVIQKILEAHREKSRERELSHDMGHEVQREMHKSLDIKRSSEQFDFMGTNHEMYGRNDSQLSTVTSEEHTVEETCEETVQVSQNETTHKRVHKHVVTKTSEHRSTTPPPAPRLNK